MSFAGQGAQDVVGVFDASFNQLFPDARAIRANVKPNAKIMQHPIETGVTITDNVVVEPTEIELSVILNAGTSQDTYQQIKTSWLAFGLLTVQTKMDTFSDMLIYAPPHDEVPEMFDTVAVAIKLRSVIIVDSQYAQLPVSSVAKKSNASTVKTGLKTPATASPAQSSSAYDLIFGSGG